MLPHAPERDSDRAGTAKVTRDAREAIILHNDRKKAGFRDKVRANEVPGAAGMKHARWEAALLKPPVKGPFVRSSSAPPDACAGPGLPTANLELR